MSIRRGNGYGTLQFKGEGKPWLARWTFAGKSYSKSTGETNKNKALKVLEQFTRPFRDATELEAIKSLKRKVEDKAESIKENQKKQSTIYISQLKEAFDNNLISKDLAKRSIEIAYYRINMFQKWMKQNRKFVDQMKFVDRKTALDFMSYCSRYSPETYNGLLKFFKRIWNVFKDDAGLDENVFENINFRKKIPSERRDLTIEELFKIFEKIRDDEEMLCLFSMGLYFGGRLIDMSCAKWESFDIKNRTFNYTPIKTRKSGTVITIKIKKSLFSLLLKRYNEKSDSVYILPEMARTYKNGYLRHRIKVIFDSVGIKTYEDINGSKKHLASFHSLRHTFISLSLNTANLSSLVVQKLVGHTHLAQTTEYFHKNDGVVDQALEMFPELINNETKDNIDLTLNDDDLLILKSCFDENIDKNLSDVVKKLVNFYKSNNIIDV